ncbi:unnamed protein product, partial [Aphanomyces euteiches]
RQDIGKTKGKGKVKAKSLSTSAIRKRLSRDTEKQLIQTTKELVSVLQFKLETYQARDQMRKKSKKLHELARQVAEEEMHALCDEQEKLKMDVERRELLKSWLVSWAHAQSPHESGPNYMEVTLLRDDDGRRRGCVHMTHRTHMMSQQAYPSKPFGNKVEDKTEVKMHLGQDDHGTCIKAYECHLQYTIFANYENVAKTWRMDLTDSTPILRLTFMEEIDEHIAYIFHEHTHLKQSRIGVIGVFRGYDGQDRITITQTGIVVDERCPFVQGETRSNGIQWVLFEHVTDLITIVRWSLLIYCPVNANGSLSLHEVAHSVHSPVSPFDSDEVIVERLCLVAERALNSIRDQFRKRCDRFKLESFTMGTRDPLFNVDD